MVGLGFLGCYYKELVTSLFLPSPPSLPPFPPSPPPFLLPSFPQTHMEPSLSARPSQAQVLAWGAGSGLGDEQVGMACPETKANLHWSIS